MYIPEFIVGFIAGAVTTMILLTIAVWKCSEKEGVSNE